MVDRPSDNIVISAGKVDPAKYKAEVLKEGSRAKLLDKIDLRVMEDDQAPILALLDGYAKVGLDLEGSRMFVNNLVQYQTAKNGKGLNFAVDLLKDQPPMSPLLYPPPEKTSLLSWLNPGNWGKGKKDKGSSGGEY